MDCTCNLICWITDKPTLSWSSAPAVHVYITVLILLSSNEHMSTGTQRTRCASLWSSSTRSGRIQRSVHVVHGISWSVWFGLNHRKIRLIESKEKCRHLKKLTVKGFCGRCLSVWAPPPLTHCTCETEYSMGWTDNHFLQFFPYELVTSIGIALVLILKIASKNIGFKLCPWSTGSTCFLASWFRIH